MNDIEQKESEEHTSLLDHHDHDHDHEKKKEKKASRWTSQWKILLATAILLVVITVVCVLLAVLKPGGHSHDHGSSTAESASLADTPLNKILSLNDLMGALWEREVKKNVATNSAKSGGYEQWSAQQWLDAADNIAAPVTPAREVAYRLIKEVLVPYQEKVMQAECPAGNIEGCRRLFLRDLGNSEEDVNVGVDGDSEGQSQGDAERRWRCAFGCSHP